MLTGDLVRVRRSKGELLPGFLDPSAPRHRERAEALVATYQQGLEGRWTRAQLDDEVQAVTGDATDHKVVQGLAKLCADRSEFEVQSPLDPIELRARVFARAAERGPLALTPGLMGRPTADDVLAEIAAELAVTAEVVADALYADLPESQRITRFRVPDAAWLLHRYNVSLVQAVLLHAESVEVELVGATAPRLRQLLRLAKFHQLMHRAHRQGEALTLVVDGPTSLFQHSTRYGRNLANFFPAILLQDAPWTMRAQVRWGPQKVSCTLTVDRDQGLVSHYADTGAWQSQAQQWFVERWEKADTDWKLTEETTPMPLGPRHVLLPDFTLRKGKRVAHLEIIGFWRREWLEGRLEALRRHAPKNLIIAVSNKLCGDKGVQLDDLPFPVIPYANIVPTKQVLEAVAANARRE